ncbi:MAG: DUF4446 family protein [bacterium]
MPNFISWLKDLSVYSFLAVIVLFLFCLVLLILFLRERSRIRILLGHLRSLLRGEEHLNLEEALGKLGQDVEKVAKENEELNSRLSLLEHRSQRFLQGTALERYNAFPDTSGDLSFSLAVLDAQSNGWVITGLYGRESYRIYAKPIKKGISTYPLTEEEKKAIEKAEDYILGRR